MHPTPFTPGLMTACQRLAQPWADAGAEVTPHLLGQSSNLAVALEPLPLVARIATGTAVLRTNGQHAEREVALTAWLAQRGAAVGQPASASQAGPHQLQADGRTWTTTVWQRLAVTPGEPSAHQAGQALAHIHHWLHHHNDDAALASLPGADWAVFDELQALLLLPAVQASAPAAQRAFVAEQALACAEQLKTLALPCQWVHGDAHLNNVLNTAAGPLWVDWEDATRAPVHWDLAGLLAGARVLGTHAAWTEAALAGWESVAGPLRSADQLAALALCIRARTLFVCAWMWALGLNDETRRTRHAARLAWLGWRG